jgi:hypothetical protein
MSGRSCDGEGGRHGSSLDTTWTPPAVVVEKHWNPSCAVGSIASSATQHITHAQHQHDPPHPTPRDSRVGLMGGGCALPPGAWVYAHLGAAPDAFRELKQRPRLDR